MGNIYVMHCPKCGKYPDISYNEGRLSFHITHCRIDSGYFKNFDRTIIGWNMAVDWYKKYGEEE